MPVKNYQESYWGMKPFLCCRQEDADQYILPDNCVWLWEVHLRENFQLRRVENKRGQMRQISSLLSQSVSTTKTQRCEWYLKPNVQYLKGSKSNKNKTSCVSSLERRAFISAWRAGLIVRRQLRYATLRYCTYVGLFRDLWDFNLPSGLLNNVRWNRDLFDTDTVCNVRSCL